MMFDQFCRAHGLLVDGIQAGRWVRVPTVDHPRSENGAYKFLGDVGWVQNWATMSEPETWRPEAHEVQKIDVERIRRESERHVQRVRDGWAKAGTKAAKLIASARPGEHNYLHLKGLSDQAGLVTDDGALVVPMRHWRTNALVGAQVIRWDEAARKFDKRMLPGMRAKGATFRLGSPTAPRTWLVEGYATGLSVHAALRLMRLSDAVLVCFSAGNLVTVARELGGRLVAFADNDQSGAGVRAAVDAGVPYVMSSQVGEDANDVHRRAGVFALASLMRSVGTS
jgi:phage/plasmid primase-like uncharacterized protein